MQTTKVSRLLQLHQIFILICAELVLNHFMLRLQAIQATSYINHIQLYDMVQPRRI